MSLLYHDVICGSIFVLFSVLFLTLLLVLFLTLFLTPMTISIFHLPCKLVACVHRHYVFTIPKELRAYFSKTDLS